MAMARHWKIAILILAMAAFAGVWTFPSLLRNVLRLRRAPVTEEQARREIVQEPISTPTDAPQKAQLFWASVTSFGALEPTEIDLPLSADPAERAKQLIAALIARAPSAAQRTLPANAELLQLYVLQDGTTIADFSEALPTQVPSGIVSEQMAVDSIAHTLGANVPGISRLKILIHGQEADTLAGHVDLSVFFPVMAPVASPESDTAPTGGPASPISAASPPPISPSAISPSSASSSVSSRPAGAAAPPVPAKSPLPPASSSPLQPH
jgi:Sporulation and spore germination